MPIRNILNKSSDWLRGEGPHHHIVVTSRIRLARNLAGVAFPGRAKTGERVEVLEKIRPKVEALPEMVDAVSLACQDLSPVDKLLLVDDHPLLLLGLRALLSRNAKLRIVAECGDALSAIECLR
ncbi:MAG: hypothetical protein EBS01_13450, partial [Verrucomicrobia bacterium]|nr:hypothetical protein [Verrucomicrobiota bacterium]